MDSERRARVVISATAARYSSRFDRMLRVPVVSGPCSITIPYHTSHALVRYPDLVEFRAVRPETQPLVESAGIGLRVQVHLGESALSGEVHEAAHDRESGPGAT